MSSTNHIIWHQLATESPAERIDRLNKELHRIFFDGKPCHKICPSSWFEPTHDIICRICGARADDYLELKHSTPPFFESLDAMQLVIESGKFAEVREEFDHWLSKERHECTIFLYGQIGSGIYFREKGASRQEAFYLTALKAMGYTVVMEGHTT